MQGEVFFCIILFVLFVSACLEYMTPLNRFDYEDIERIQKELRERQKDRQISKELERISREAQELLEESEKLKQEKSLLKNQTYKKGQVIRLKSKALVFKCREEEYDDDLNPIYFVDGSSFILEEGTQLEFVQYGKELLEYDTVFINKSKLYARVLANKIGLPAGSLVYVLRTSNTESSLKQPLEKPKMPSL